MDHAQLAGSLVAGSTRLGAPTTIWCPLLAAAALVLLVLAAVTLSKVEEDERTDADRA
jgi:hypothetical protein